MWSAPSISWDVLGFTYAFFWCNCNVWISLKKETILSGNKCLTSFPTINSCMMPSAVIKPHYLAICYSAPVFDKMAFIQEGLTTGSVGMNSMFSFASLVDDCLLRESFGDITKWSSFLTVAIFAIYFPNNLKILGFKYYMNFYVFKKLFELQWYFWSENWNLSWKFRTNIGKNGISVTSAQCAMIYSIPGIF